MHLLLYRHMGNLRSAVFSHAQDARAWGEYCFHSLKGCTGAAVFRLVDGTPLWTIGDNPKLQERAAMLDWNHNERN